MFAIISTNEQLALARRGILIHENCYSTARDKCYTVNCSQKKNTLLHENPAVFLLHKNKRQFKSNEN